MYVAARSTLTSVSPQPPRPYLPSVRRHAAILLSFLLLAAGAPVAGAATTVAPPGQSAIDEYLETIPSDGGNTAAGGSAGKPTPAAGVRSTAVVPARTLLALRSRGADGRAAASLAVAAAPPPAARRGLGSSAPGVIAVKGERAGGGALSTLTSAVTGTKGGGSGALLPILLILIVLAGVGVGVLRRRGDGAPA